MSKSALAHYKAMVILSQIAAAHSVGRSLQVTDAELVETHLIIWC